MRLRHYHVVLKQRPLQNSAVPALACPQTKRPSMTAYGNPQSMDKHASRDPATSPCIPFEKNCSWIWADDAVAPGRHRIDRVLFRRELNLTGVPEKAIIHLSARLNYHLRINGRMFGYGPARSYPDFHEFDTYDLRDHLVEGVNILEAEVLHWNLTTFHGLLEEPGFIASGEVRDAQGSTLGLETPGDWRCRRREGVDVTAPRLSFAQGPVEIVDMRLDDAPWQTPRCAAEGLTNPLRPRTIPPLTQHKIPAASLTSAAINSGEIILGGRLVFDGAEKNNPYPPRDASAAMAAWVHSPSEQTVPVGIWWGEYLINGVPCPARPDKSLPLRNATEFSLRAGWNKLVATQGLSFGYAEFCLAVPKNAGIVFKTERCHEAPDGVLVAALFSPEAFRSRLPELKTPDGAFPDIAWRRLPPDLVPVSALRHIAWSQPTSPLAPTKLPIAIPPGTPTLITLDMGRIVFGRLSFDLEAPAGTVLDVAHAEEQRNGRAFLGKTVVMYSADRWVLPDGRQTIESFSPRGFRYLDILIAGHAAPVTLYAAGVVEQRYPHDFTGTFECSDDDFNRLWAYGRRTLELCSEDVFTDCPWRERTLYGGDLLAETATTAVLTHDLRLVRQSLEVLLQSVGEHGWLQSRAPAERDEGSLYDYPLLTSLAVDWYVRLSNDLAFASRAWPVFKTMAAAVAAWQRDDGLYAPPLGAFIDHGRNITKGATVAFNAALASSFRTWAAVGRLAGAKTESDELARLGNDLDSRIPGAFFDVQAGTFRDMPLADGEARTEGTPPNTWPLLFCRSAQAQAPAALAAITRTLAAYNPDRESESISPYQMFYLLSVLGEHGSAEQAESTIRRVYALMLDNPSGTLWEHSRPTQSLVHAWSSGVNFYFATTILGVKMGFLDPEELTTIHIAPCAESVTWARGRVCHPLGTIDIAWERRDDGLHITLAAPAGVPVLIAPAGPLANLPCFVDGMPL